MSTSGLEWSMVSRGPWSPRRKHCTLLYDDKLVLMGGFDGEKLDLNDVWTYDFHTREWSLTCEHAGWSGRDGHGAVVFQNAIYITGGTNDPYNCRADVWKSQDGGISWIQCCAYAPWPERWQHASCVHDGKIFVMGGWGDSYLNDVWMSPDGIHWEQRCVQAPWKARMFAIAISINGSIYIMGGHDSKNYLKDVWASSDNGKTWTQVCSAAEWEGRQGHCVNIIDNAVYLIGGSGPSKRFNDVWRSSDCATWTCVSESSMWSPRQGAATIARGGSIYVMGGVDDDGYCNDMYVSSTYSSSSSGNGGSGGNRGRASSSDIYDLSNPGRSLSLAPVMESVSKLKGSRLNLQNILEAMRELMQYIKNAENKSKYTQLSINASDDDPLSESDDLLNEVVEIQKDNPEERFNTIYSSIIEPFDADSTGSKVGAIAGTDADSTNDDDSRSRETSTDLTTLQSFAVDNVNPRDLFFSTFAIEQDLSSAREKFSALADIPHSDSLSSVLRHDERESLGGHENSMNSLLNSRGRDSTGGLVSSNEKRDLRGNMTSLMNKIRKIQKSIRHAAEIDAGEDSQTVIEKSIQKRKELAETGYSYGLRMLHHIIHQRFIKEKRHQRLLLLRAKVQRLHSTFVEESHLLNMRRQGSTESMTSSTSFVQESGGDNTTESIARAGEEIDWATGWRNSCLHLSQLIDTVGKANGIRIQQSMGREMGISPFIDDGMMRPVDIEAEQEQEGREEHKDLVSLATSSNDMLEKMPDTVAQTNEVVKTLMDLMTEKSAVSAKIAEWLEVQSAMDSSVSNTVGKEAKSAKDADASGKPPLPLSKTNNNQSIFDDLGRKYEAIEDQLYENRTNVKLRVDQEIARLVILDVELRGYLKNALVNGLNYVQSMLTQNDGDMLRFNDAQTEVCNWIRVCIVLSNQSILDDRCNALVDFITEKEQALLQYEVIPIDIRATLSKASLEAKSWSRSQSKQGRRLKSSSGSGSKVTPNKNVMSPPLSPTSSTSDHGTEASFSSEGTTNSAFRLSSLKSGGSSGVDENLIDTLKLELVQAEKRIKVARKDLRGWNREIRKLALEYAPEMFYMLPDLQSPGAVMGDGGFAEIGNTIRRRFEDYEVEGELVPRSEIGNTDSNNGKSNSSSKRHTLLRAKYDDEDVVLKMFVMSDSSQRKGLERELSILGPLRNDAIIAPTAMVDGASSDDVDQALRKMAVYIEFPYYKAGNLNDWSSVEHKPWELQGISRQILYALLFIHDHHVVHNQIHPSNILMTNDGRIVLSNFSAAKKIDHTVFTEGSISESTIMDAASFADNGATSPMKDGRKYNEMTTTSSPSALNLSRMGDQSNYLAPEVESAGNAVFASDMYSFGVLLTAIHFPDTVTTIIPGSIVLPGQADPELSDLIKKLTQIDITTRPTAAQALLHPYFRRSFVERLQQEGEIVEQDRKLDAVRDMLRNARYENRNNIDRLHITRDTLVETVLKYFEEMTLDKMRCSLRIIFEGEPGVDEGGLLTEMFHLFFEEVLDPSKSLLFEGSAHAYSAARHSRQHSTSSTRDDNNNNIYDDDDDNYGMDSVEVGSIPLHSRSMDSTESIDSDNINIIGHSYDGLASRSYDDKGEIKSINSVVLPVSKDISQATQSKLRAFGRIIVKALYEGRRIGGRLCVAIFKFITNSAPTIRDLQLFDPQAAKSCEWILATENVDTFELHFESVNRPDLGNVNDSNKVDFVKMKIMMDLFEKRRVNLNCVKEGFVEALRALAPEAAPFMSLLSHTDWKVMLCGEDTITGPQVMSSLRFTNFKKQSKIPEWLREIVLSASEDHLRKFLVFMTGSPSLHPTSGSRLDINVRAQPRSNALPTAHTCFFHLDIPDYKDKETLQSKLIYAITHTQSFEVV
jgi:serine/threonine protein kinase/N-acetylneuraminic acid mutarotase